MTISWFSLKKYHLYPLILLKLASLHLCCILIAHSLGCNAHVRRLKVVVKVDQKDFLDDVVFVQPFHSLRLYSYPLFMCLHVDGGV